MRAASLLDLAGTKVKALLPRVEAKDYRDIVALLEHGVRLEDILGSARALFGLAFNPLIAQKTLVTSKAGTSSRWTAICEPACWPPLDTT